MLSQTEQQLSFFVAPHPSARLGDGLLDGSLSIGGGFGVRRDLQAGDALTVTVADADGEVIATGLIEVQSVAFRPVRFKGEVVGTERFHTAKAAA